MPPDRAFSNEMWLSKYVNSANETMSLKLTLFRASKSWSIASERSFLAEENVELCDVLQVELE